jgi:hypothetical protein
MPNARYCLSLLLLKLCTALAGGFAVVTGAAAQDYAHQPWLSPAVPLVLKLSAADEVDWNKLAADRRVKAVFHRASDGESADARFAARAAEARARGLMWGAYHAMRPGNYAAQADLLLQLARASQTKFLAVALADAPLIDADQFLSYVHDRTGRFPIVHIDDDALRKVSGEADINWAFARTALWIDHRGPELKIDNATVWDDWLLWQFADAATCNTGTCPYRVPGLTGGAVSAFKGDAGRLRARFD